MQPRISGQGFVPRYGGGWMHQFGHVYALQQELLAPDRNNWMRATELWHLARHEGLALNTAHYTNILRQCVAPKAWEQSLRVLQQMRRDAIRPDVVGVACAMAACADAGAVEAVETLHATYAKSMKLDSQCYLALMKAYHAAGRPADVLRVGELQESASVPMLPASFVCLMEAGMTLADDEVVYQYASRSIQDGYGVPRALEAQLLRFADDKRPALRQLLTDASALDSSHRELGEWSRPLHLPTSAPGPRR